MPIKLNGSTSGYTQLSAPAVAGSNTLTLPTTGGTANQLMQTDGAGNMTFASVTGTTGVVITASSGTVNVALPTPGTALNYLVSDGTNWTSASFGASSFGTSGYQKLPNGFILQWGTSAVAATAGSSATTTFPIAFPTACQSVILTPTQASLVTQYSPGITVKSTTNFTYGSAGSGFASGCFYVAIGY